MQPRLFSRTAIFIVSFLVSTFFGALLFAINLGNVGKKKEIWKVLLFSLLWHGVFIILSATYNYWIITLVTTMIANGLGGFVLAKPVWDYYLKDIAVYEKRSTVGIIVMTIILLAVLTGFVLLTTQFQR